MSGQLRVRAGPLEALCDGYTWRQTCARGAAAQRAGARRARKAAAPGGTPLQVCEEPSVPTTLKGALPRARAVAAQALVTKLLHAWALLHLRFYLVVSFLVFQNVFGGAAGEKMTVGSPKIDRLKPTLPFLQCRWK